MPFAWTASKRNRLAALRTKGLSMKKIGQEFGCSEGTIYKELHRDEIAARNAAKEAAREVAVIKPKHSQPRERVLNTYAPIHLRSPPITQTNAPKPSRAELERVLADAWRRTADLSA